VSAIEVYEGEGSSILKKSLQEMSKVSSSVLCVCGCMPRACAICAARVRVALLTLRLCHITQAAYIQQQNNTAVCWTRGWVWNQKDQRLMQMGGPSEDESRHTESIPGSIPFMGPCSRYFVALKFVPEHANSHSHGCQRVQIRDWVTKSGWHLTHVMRAASAFLRARSCFYDSCRGDFVINRAWALLHKLDRSELLTGTQLRHPDDSVEGQLSCGSVSEGTQAPSQVRAPRGPHPSFRARIEMRGAQTATRRLAR
jgi:hypothetical protein